jgi:DNA-binding response OmpR family regulator
MNNTAPTSLGCGYRALVVDDEVPLAEVVASYLEREMFEVSLAHSGADALAMAREIDPDVVVRADGEPCLKQLKALPVPSRWLSAATANQM